MARTGRPVRPRKRRTLFTPKKRRLFLALLARGHTVSYAAARVAITRRAAYDAREHDAEFATAWDDAWKAGGEALEQEARRRAVEGTLRPVFQQQRLVGHVREYSDTLLIFLLKGRLPEIYRERWSAEVRTRGSMIHSGRVEVEVPQLGDPDRLATILDILENAGTLTAAGGPPGTGASTDAPADSVHPASSDAETGGVPAPPAP